ncbi:MAG TPA: single-stranded DNA-binding protein [Fibrobacteraceae bacterium]|nr:single-stranded DNA-binding protein [Fibrobacteraceae bacterium]
MAYLNKVMLIGNLGKDPEVRVTPSGTKQARFSLATTSRSKDRNTGETKEYTDWHNIVAWAGTADLLERLSIRKGTSLFVEGRLSTRSYDDPSGQKRYVTEVVLENFQILTPRGERPAGNGYTQPSGGGYAPPAHGGSSQPPSYESSAPADDLPF